MKQFLAACFILAIVSSCFAISATDIIQLAKLNTSEELLINVIQRSSLDHPVTTEEIIQLKQAGVTERVIQYLLKVSSPNTEMLPAVAGEPVQVSQNMRVYQTRDKNGRMITVATNLDENGKRMGGEAPPEPEPEQPDTRYPEYTAQEPREVYVTVRHEDGGYRDEDYGPPPDNYQPYSPYDYSPYTYSPYYSGIPYYSSGYYPGGYPNYLPQNHFGNYYFPNGVNWQVRAHVPLIHTSRPMISRPANPGSFAGHRPMQLRH